MKRADTTESNDMTTSANNSHPEISQGRKSSYRYTPNDIPGDTVTTLFVSNLHCNSCVPTIESALNALVPSPTSIEVSVVSQSVTIRHPESLDYSLIEDALDDAGFDNVSSSDPSHHVDPDPSTLSSLLCGKREKHIRQCAMCQKEYGSSIEAGLDRDLPTVDSPGSDSDAADSGPFVIILSVGGMTCTACRSSITEMMSQIHGVSQISVSLIEKSATAVIEREDLGPQIAEAIEDCGFEVQIVSIEPTQRPARGESRSSFRTVTLKIDGMFCKNCPPKIMAALDPFGTRVEVVKPLIEYRDPLITFKYHPQAPDFTIRHLIRALASAKSPPFNVSIHRPPSLEQLSQARRVEEQRSLLFRLAFAVVIAIPTFIIGIVYMTLVKKTNPVKQYLMQPMWVGNVSRTEWALFFLATPVMFYSANLFHLRSIKEIRALWRRGSPIPIWKRFVRFGSMNLLVSSAVSVAYFASIVLLALAAKEVPRDHSKGATTTYFDSVVFLAMFLLAGRVIEAYSKAQTADAITALGSLRPSEALLLIQRTMNEDADSKERLLFDDLEKADSYDGTEGTPPGLEVQKVAVELLEVGDMVRVPCGATPPADGVLVLPSKEGAFDESSLTGESKIIKKLTGDPVYLGTINKGNMVQVRIESIGGQTMLDRIVDVVREGQTRRAPIERVADIITAYFVPVVTFLAISTWLIWLILGLTGSLPEDYLDIPIGGWPVWSLGFAIAVFVVACPCGIGLAAPTALLVGSGLAAKYGILARGGGEAFQEMAQVDLVVFDKTGTLTQGGDPKVSDALILPAASKKRWSRETVLGIAAELESASSHPLAMAIRSYCKSAEAPRVTGDDFQEVSGRGMEARFPSVRCTAIIGNDAWMTSHEVAIDVGVSRQLDIWSSEAKSVVLMAIRSDEEEGRRAEGTAVATFHLVAIFAIADPLRSEAPRVVSWLQTQGIQTWIISGDNERTAVAVARAVGIPATNVIAGVLPHEKAQKVEWLQRNAAKKEVARWRKLRAQTRLNRRCVVAMVGDGINDAPALTAADIGVAIGSGSDVAISSASFILLSSNLRSLITLYDLSSRVFNRVLFNFFWAAIYNLVAIPIAAGVIYPAGHVRLDAVWSSLAMALSSVSVVCSSLLLRLYKEPRIDV